MHMTFVPADFISYSSYFVTLLINVDFMHMKQQKSDKCVKTELHVTAEVLGFAELEDNEALELVSSQLCNSCMQQVRCLPETSFAVLRIYN